MRYRRHRDIDEVIDATLVIDAIEAYFMEYVSVESVRNVIRSMSNMTAAFTKVHLPHRKPYVVIVLHGKVFTIKHGFSLGNLKMNVLRHESLPFGVEVYIGEFDKSHIELLSTTDTRAIYLAYRIGFRNVAQCKKVGKYFAVITVNGETHINIRINGIWVTLGYRYDTTIEESVYRAAGVENRERVIEALHTGIWPDDIVAKLLEDKI